MRMASFLRKIVSAAALLVFSAGASWAATGTTTGTQSRGITCENPSKCSFSDPALRAAFGTYFNFGNPFAGGFGTNSGNFNYGGGGALTSADSTRFAYSSRETGKAAAGSGGNWNVWASLSQSNVAYQYQPAQSSGHVTLTMAGVDYLFKNDMVLGLVAGWDSTRIGTTFNGGNLNSNGYMVGPYFNWRLNQNWAVDFALAFGHANVSQVDNSIGSVSGNYGDKRMISSASVSYNTLVGGKWLLTGRGSLLGTEDKYDQFTLSNGVTIASATNRITQGRIGGQVMYNGGVVLPYAGLYYLYDFQRVNQVAIGGTTPANDRDGFQAQVGVQFVPKGTSVYGGLMFSTDFGRREIKNDLFIGNIGIRF